MKKILLSIICLISFAFMQDECSEITNSEQCYDMGCEWIILYKEIGNEIIVTEGCSEIGDGSDWDDEENSCEGLTQDECVLSEGCEWLADSDNPNGWGSCIEGEWEDDSECYGLSYDDCEYLDFCEWITDSDSPVADGYCAYAGEEDDGPPDCLDDCEGIEDIDPSENPYEACDWIISNLSFDPGFASCTGDCSDETMMEINEIIEVCYECLENEDIDCADVFGDENHDEDGCFEDGEWYCFGCELFINECEYYECTEDGWQGPFELEDCSDNNDCDPDLACATVITCYEGLLYPTSCGPENCDEPIGECDDTYEGCQSDNGDWYDFGYEMFINDCEYYECTLNGWVGPFELDDCGEQDWECSDLTQDECVSLEECEWLTDSDNPNSWGSCVDIEDDNDGPPECVMDCEGIEDVSPEDDATYFCNWLLDTFPSGCAEDCEQDVLDDIEEFMIVCDECLADNNCDGIFDDSNDDGCFEDGEWYCFGCELFINECEYYECTEDGWQGPFELDGCEDNAECSELNYPDCIDTEGCEWIISNEWGGYSCVESNDEDNCSDLGYEDCLENPNCQPNYNAAGQFEGCEEFNNQQSFGFLYGTVSYIYGDVIDFIPYTTLHIESLPSNADMYYFEVMTDGEGYYQIELPVGAYTVTAYVNEESLTLDAQINPDSEFELNFLLGDWGGPWYPYAQLSLGEYHTAIPGGEVVLPLYLSSNEFVGGVQFTIAVDLPGLNLVAFESIDPCFSADFNMIDDLQTIGIIFSFEGCSYPPEEMLEIANLVYNVSPYVPIGVELEVFFSNTIVSDSIGNEIPSYGEGAIIMLGAKGDVNADGEFNVLDVVMMVNFVLYVEYPNDLEFWASDMNNDGMVNVLDVVQLVNLILD